MDRTGRRIGMNDEVRCWRSCIENNNVLSSGRSDEADKKPLFLFFEVVQICTSEDLHIRNLAIWG
jgi:hypothetical protein